MSKLVLLGLLALGAAGPALAFNEPSASGELSVAQAVGLPTVATCRPATVKPPLSPEQRAQRKAMRAQKEAQRVAQGLPPKARHAHPPKC
jgi:hypothetical protein